MPEAYLKPYQVFKMIRLIENTGIVRTIYSIIFRHIEGHSAIFSHVQAYGGMFRHTEAGIFRPY